MTIRRARALLYGLNYTSCAPGMQLRGCWNDAIALSHVLTSDRFGLSDSDVDVVLDNSVQNRMRCTRSGILASLQQLCDQSWAGEGLDVVFVSFSCHGSQHRDANGDEADGYDEGICPIDCMQTGLILDDDLKRVFLRFNPRTRVLAVFDCCHSGSMLDLPHTLNATSEAAAAATDETPKIVMMSGCLDPQTSADAFDMRCRRFGGALTNAILKIVREEPRIGIIDLHRAALKILQTEGFGQHPIVSSTHPITNDTWLW